ncbi:hypothetical protein PPROV_000589500 [Pycnococcus provasolii]|uniref:Uncharacterized protein n=1 Tax=Pycnococcus provasolii TaxID=41880 RepID=A0A830HJV4_9CHLO|nr:hypothetical protein PPROV_000589500 [Pycnococcus provasolii]
MSEEEPPPPPAAAAPAAESEALTTTSTSAQRRLTRGHTQKNIQNATEKFSKKLDDDAASVVSFKLALHAYRPGSNTLRGVKKTFTQHTLQDNWVEDRSHPASKGHHATRRPRILTAYETTASAAMRSGVGGSVPVPKAGPRNVVNPETVKVEWESVTKSAFRPPSDTSPTEFASTFKPRKPKPELVQSYSHWAKESGRFNRFSDGTEYNSRFQTRRA